MEAQRSWDWPGSEGKKAEIEIFARASRVELFLNGRKVAAKKPKKGIARFSALYEPGELLAVSYDVSGKEIGRDSLRTAGADVRLSLECESSACRPGEMVFLRVRFTDSEGILKPMEKHSVRFSAENGTVIGTANGSCSFKGNFAQNEAPTYFGEMQAVVQADKPGFLQVTAESGTYRAEVRIPVGE